MGAQKTRVLAVRSRIWTHISPSIIVITAILRRLCTDRSQGRDLSYGTVKCNKKLRDSIFTDGRSIVDHMHKNHSK